MRAVKEFLKGLWEQNPVFVLVLGMCPTLAVTTSVENAIGMGVATTFVLVCSNAVVSLVRNFIPSRVRIPAYIVIIASFVTIADMLLAAYAYSVWKRLGIFVPLIVVNCIIMGRAEGFASKNNFFYSVLDGLGMGIGFTLGIIILAGVREFLGNGTLLGISILNLPKILVFILPPGAFMTLGVLLALMNKINNLRKS